MMSNLSDIASRFYIADFDFPKALTKEEIAEEINFENIELVDDYVQFIENYQGEGLIITGSLYFISEVKAKTKFKELKEQNRLLYFLVLLFRCV